MFDTPDMPNKYVKNVLVKIPMVRLGILHMLSKKSMCGNEIAMEMHKNGPKMRRNMAQKSFSHKKLNPNVLYPLLHNLEEEGFIKGEWDDKLKRTRRFYSVTPKGKAMFKRLKIALKPEIKAMIETMRRMSKDLFGEEL